MFRKTKKITCLSKTPNLFADDSVSKVEEYFKEYSEHTGIQGFQYLAENRTKTEKVFWCLIMICSLSGGIFMIAQLWSKYQQAPVFVSYETSQTSINDIPFPAVTICSESIFRSSSFTNFSEYLIQIHNNKDFSIQSLSLEEQNQINSLLVVCALLLQSLSEEFPITVDDNIYGILEELQTEFEKVVIACIWLNKEVNCSSIFVPVITSEGICYSFNILDKSEMFRGKVYPHYSYYNVVRKSDWNIDKGYLTMSLDTHPRRALSSGENYGLKMFLQGVSGDLEQICKNGREGFRVCFHNPLDMPSPNLHYIRVNFNKIVLAKVKPKLISTSQNLRRYSPEKRKCYFSDERPLKYFNIYTSLNCELECLTDFVLEVCGCVHLYMPRRKKTNICGPGSLNCLAIATEQYRFRELDHRMRGSHSECDCKSACTELSYNDVEVLEDSYSADVFRDLYGESDFGKINDGVKITILSILFDEDQFWAYRRGEQYGISDLISNIGGLLSLFTGFCMMSFVEIIYFLTLRIYYNIKLYGSWSGPIF